MLETIDSLVQSQRDEAGLQQPLSGSSQLEASNRIEAPYTPRKRRKNGKGLACTIQSPYFSPCKSSKGSPSAPKIDTGLLASQAPLISPPEYRKIRSGQDITTDLSEHLAKLSELKPLLIQGAPL